jgi:hypothetical protein
MRFGLAGRRRAVYADGLPSTELAEFRRAGLPADGSGISMHHGARRWIDYAFSTRLTPPAKSLRAAVREVVPVKKRSTKRKVCFPINLSYNSKTRLFQVTDALYRLVSLELPLKASWPERVQVDGRQFRDVLDT